MLASLTTIIVIIIIIVLRRCGDWCWHSWSVSSPPPSSGSSSSPREAPIWEECLFLLFPYMDIFVLILFDLYFFHFSINPQVDFFTERSCNLGISLIPSHAIQPGWAEIESISSGSRLSLWNTQQIHNAIQQQHYTWTTQYTKNTKHNNYLRVEVFDSRLSDHRWRADTRPRATPPSPELSSCLKIKIIQGSLQNFVQTFQSWQGHC